MKYNLTIHTCSKIITAFYSIITAFIFLKTASTNGEIKGLLILIALYLFVISPMFVFIPWTKISRHPKILLLFQFLIAVVTQYTYIDAMFIHLDALNGLVFFALPILQYMLIVALAVLLAIINWITKV